MQDQIKNIPAPLPFFLLAFLLTFLVREHVFFWDTISQASRRAQWYYDTNFQYLLLPYELDSGHPPLFNMYVAAAWKAFGRSLTVSHFAMLPFLLGIIWQWHRLLLFFFPEKIWYWLGMVILIADPVMAAQSTLVSPDLVLTFAYLGALNDIFRKRHTPLFILYLFLLLACSLRGILLVSSLGILDLCLFFHRNRSLPKISWYLPYLLAALPLLFFYSLRKLEMGWWVRTPNPAWSHHREVATLQQIFRNAGVFAWRLLDHGRIFIWLPTLMLFWKYKAYLLRNNRPLSLLAAVGAPFIVFTPVFLFSQSGIALRYLLPLFLPLSLLFLCLLRIIFFRKPFQGKAVVLGLCLLLFSGNFWVYPRKIAQNWDATLAHLPYYRARAKAMQYLDNQHIDTHQFGTQFPNKGKRSAIELGSDTSTLEVIDWERHEVLLYSEVMNDFSDQEFDHISTHWKADTTFGRWPVRFWVYRKK